MSWTCNREKGDYEDYVVRDFLPMTFDKLQYIRIYWNQQHQRWTYEFLFHGIMNKLNVKYFFKKQNYIGNTYIRKDKFQVALHKTNDCKCQAHSPRETLRLHLQDVMQLPIINIKVNLWNQIGLN